jgi:hypothetical protein
MELVYLELTIHTAYVKVKTNSEFSGHNVCMCFVWSTEQAAFTSLNSADWIIFAIGMHYVFCELKTEYLNVT